MPMFSCRECGAKLETNFGNLVGCPECGAKQPHVSHSEQHKQRFFLNVFFKGIALIGAILFLFFTIFIDDLRESKLAGMSPISVTSDQLCAAYNDNGVAADNRYHGKKVHIVGEVSDIGSDGVVHLKCERPWACRGCDGNVNLYGINQSVAAGLQKGQMLKAECMGDGADIFSSPDLKWCKQIPLLPAPSGDGFLAVGDLCKAYSQDDITANEKYSGRRKLVGTIEDIDPNIDRMPIQRRDNVAIVSLSCSGSKFGSIIAQGNECDPIQGNCGSADGFTPNYVKTLRNGQKIKLSCHVGMNIDGVPSLKMCEPAD